MALVQVNEAIDRQDEMALMAGLNHPALSLLEVLLQNSSWYLAQLCDSKEQRMQVTEWNMFAWCLSLVSPWSAWFLWNRILQKISGLYFPEHYKTTCIHCKVHDALVWSSKWVERNYFYRRSSLPNNVLLEVKLLENCSIKILIWNNGEWRPLGSTSLLKRATNF